MPEANEANPALKWLANHVLRDHVGLGFLVALVLTKTWGVGNALLFWASTVLVDLDHYLNLLFWSRGRSVAFFKVFTFYAYMSQARRSGRPLLTLEIFHTAEFLLALFLAGFPLGAEVLRPVFFGIVFHVLVDLVHLWWIGALRVRAHSVVEYLIRKAEWEKRGISPAELPKEAAESTI